MILITGASGMVGRALTLKYSASGKKMRLQVRTTDRDNNCASVDADVENVDFAIANEHQIAQLVDGCATVVHCAGVVHQPQAPNSLYEAVNVRATNVLIKAAEKAGVRNFVLCSTSAVYGNGPFTNISENAELAPATEYARSKVECETLLRHCQGIEKRIILRPSLVFGEGDRGNMIALIRQIKKGRYFHIGGNEARKSVIYARDLANIIDSCLMLDEGLHVFNAADPEPVNVVELANTIAACLGRANPPVMPLSFAKGSAKVAQSILGRRAPLTLEKIDKLMTSTTLAVDKLLTTTAYRPEYTLSQALRNEIQSAFGAPAALRRQ